MEKHRTVPVFVPHQGCPHACVFCDQKSITGTAGMSGAQLREYLEKAVSSLPPDTSGAEIAFFGGSFTGIERERMLDYLEAGAAYVRSGRISSLRCSTRPDYISTEILDVLASYGLKTVELGIQSMSDSVLSLCERGHTAEDSRRAARLVREHGMDLVGQMMTGLPGSSPEDEVRTAEEICRMGACGARIYPTLVFAGTKLNAMRAQGLYEPLTLGDAVSRTAACMRIFLDRGVRLLRVGLCETGSLSGEDGVCAGPYHPAIGELCASALYLRILSEKAAQTDGDVVFIIPAGHLSRAIGHRKSNIASLSENFPGRRFTFRESPDAGPYEVLIG